MKGWLDRAITEYKRAIELDPDNALAHTNLGAAYVNKDLLDQAIAEHKRAIELDPNNANAHYNLASAYVGYRCFDLAWKHVRIAEKLGMSTQNIDWLINLLRKVSREPQEPSGRKMRRLYLKCKTCQTEFPVPMWSEKNDFARAQEKKRHTILCLSQRS